MRLWRIFNPKYPPLSTFGSATYGGRWNPVGCPVLYMGENLSLVAWERYVHIEVKPPTDLNLAAIFIDLTPELISKISHCENLHPNWRDLEKYPYTQSLGQEWIDSIGSPILRVPSAVIPYQYNYLVNPNHPLVQDLIHDRYYQLDINSVDPLNLGIFGFKFDERA